MWRSYNLLLSVGEDKQNCERWPSKVIRSSVSIFFFFCFCDVCRLPRKNVRVLCLQIFYEYFTISEIILIRLETSCKDGWSITKNYTLLAFPRNSFGFSPPSSYVRHYCHYWTKLPGILKFGILVKSICPCTLCRSSRLRPRNCNSPLSGKERKKRSYLE